MPHYTVGRTIKTTPEHPIGVPCILYDGDSVLCEFPSVMFGESQASVVCETLNNARENAVALTKYC